MFLDGLEVDSMCGGDDKVYHRKTLVDSGFEIIELPGDGILVRKDPSDTWIEFAVLEWHTEYMHLGEVLAVEYSMLFHGQGTGGCLRELRHTYWGEDGYLFYINRGLVEAAFKALEQWFNI